MKCNIFDGDNSVIVLRVFFLLLFFLLFDPVFTQNTDTRFFRNETKDEQFEAGLPIISFMALPSYTPEMEFNITGGTLLSFKTRRNNPYLSHSYWPLILSLSPDGNFSGTTRLTSYWTDDRFLFTFDISCFSRDDNFWGIGIDAAQTVKKGSLTTAYHQQYFNLNPVFYARIITNLYAGLILEWNKTNASQLNDLMKEDPEIIEHGTIISSSGAGISILFDSRDNKTKPLKGIRLNIQGLLFNEKFGSDTDFGSMTFDYRQYQPVIRDGSVLAWNINTRFSAGDVPWTGMQQVGLTDNLRGFYPGQYRDYSSAFTLVEYRHTLLKRASSEFSRHGFVFWICAGTVFQKIVTIDNGILSIGVGYRFEIQPYMNLRIDLGFSTENTGIYMGFCEAF